MQLPVDHWGLIEYTKALEKQLTLVETLRFSDQVGRIVVCSHPPVVTLGRKTEPGDVDSWQGPIVDVSRGGRATYHGPNQVVVYPILKLDAFKRDIDWFLRTLEAAGIAMLKEFGLQAHAHDTGLWVSEKKVASIGIAVKHWISFHGIAVNVSIDPAAFRGMKPCGYSPDVMTSMEALLGDKVNPEQVAQVLTQKLQINLGNVRNNLSMKVETQLT